VPAFARQQAGGQRVVRQEPDAELPAARQHVVLRRAVKERVLVLDGGHRPAIRPQPRQRRVDGSADVGRRTARPRRTVLHVAAEVRREDDAVAPAPQTSPRAASLAPGRPYTTSPERFP
jgi:hypothetical protein